MRNKQYDRQFKIVMTGNSSVGKSCLLLRFADDQFIENHISTIGVDFRFKTLNIDAKKIKLQIWDTAGQEKYRTITNTYYKKADAVIMMYDISDRQSFSDVDKYWLNQVQSYADQSVVVVLVGNKSDLQEQRKVTKQEGQQYAKSKKMLFFQASAKTAEHVNDVFVEISRKLNGKVIDRPKKAEQLQSKKISSKSSNRNQEQKKGLCC